MRRRGWWPLCRPVAWPSSTVTIHGYRAMATLAPGEAWTFGLGEGNDVRAADVAVDWPFGMRFTAIVRGESHPVSIPMLGRHMVPPALAALAVAAVEGLPIAQAAAALSRAVPVSYRLEVVPLAMGATLICDHHKNSAESIRAALELVADVPGRKILVISRVRAGTVDTEPVLREVASMAARLIDQMIVIGDGVEGLVAAACAAGLSPDRVHRAEPGVLDAMRLLRELMRPSDIVLLKARLASKLDRLILGLQGRHVACDLAYCSLFALGCAECAHLGHARRGRLG